MVIINMNDSIEMAVFILIILLTLIMGYSSGVTTGKKSLVNQLCNKQQYDFCVIREYKLKE